MLLFLCPFAATAQQTAEKKDAQKTETAEAVEDSTKYERPAYNYRGAGKRDPFNSLAPVVEEEGPEAEKPIKDLFNYEGASLKGIVTSGEDYYALVTDEHEYSYVLREGYKVFGGYVTNITEDSIRLHIVKYGRAMTILFRLEDSKSTIEEIVGASEVQVKKPGIEIQYSTKEVSAENPVIQVDEVMVNSLDTKTIDETWFRPGADNNETADTKDTDDGGQAAFSIISPPNATLVSLPYELNWSDRKGLNVTYRIVFDDDRDFSSPLFMRGDIPASSYILANENGIEPGMTLYWKVTAHDADGGVFASRQDVMSFTIR